MEVEELQVKTEKEVKSEPVIQSTILTTTLDPDFPEKYHEIYGAYKEKDYDLCLSYIDGVSEDHIEYQILKSACLIHSGKKVSEAHKILDSVLEKDPGNAYTLYAKGLAFYHDDQWEDSITYFKKALEMDSGDMERAELMMERAEEKMSERQRRSVKKHRASVKTFKQQPRASRIIRRFGCDICNHFFGKKYNLDRHNRSLHKRNTPVNFPTSQKQITNKFKLSSKKVASKLSPGSTRTRAQPKIKQEPVETYEDFNDEETEVESQNDSVISSKSEPTARSKSAPVKKGFVLCPVCKKQFKRSSIARHVVIHSGNKAHKCHECPSAFFQKSDLTRHIVS